MPNLVLKSERQIQTSMLAVLIAQLGLNDINPASVIDILTQAAAQSDFAQYYQIAQVSRLADIESLSGTDLELKAFEYGIFRLTAQKASGSISILRPTGFVKVSTTFYAGFPAPIVGDSTINVNDASNVLIGSSGTLILGRGTNNEEQVTYSVAPVNNINYFTYTLNAPVTKNHSTSETIILRQGTDEFVLAGTIVVVPATGTSNEIQFATVNDETLLAGEAEVDNVEVIAVVPGSDGNIAAGSIFGTAAFPSPPFIGARATNAAKYTTGQDLEQDDDLRDRIKNAVQALTKGIKQAIQTAIVGLVDPISAKRVVSASIVLPIADVDAVKIYIDDGTGFEPSFNSQGFETVRANSTGGEQRLQLDQFPVVKAQVENNLFQPYDMSSGPLTLTYQVGTLIETVTFQTSDFDFPSIAQAEEVVVAINARSNLIEARTSEAGQKIVITAKADVNENIQILSGTANSILFFPTDRRDTLNLYMDDVKLSKDGATAILDSGNQAPYNLLAIGAYPHFLTFVVDGKTANPQTATINLADVAIPAAVTAIEVAAMINRDISGLTATPINTNTKVRLESNTKLTAASKIHVTGGDANNSLNGLNFSTTEVAGINGDYTFNRELGLIQLVVPMGVNQTATSGSLFTRAKLRAGNSEVYSPSNGQTLVISVDGGSNQTVTFDASFAGGQTAQYSAAFINARLLGATAVVRQVGFLNFLEIRTNTFDVSGSIVIRGSSTGNSTFAFPLDLTKTSDVPNKAYKVSEDAGPYAFAEGNSLVVVIDNDIVNNTFSVPLIQVRSVSGATSGSVFAASTLNNVFTLQNQIVGYAAAFQNGPNTTSGTVVTVSVLGGGIARYTFSAAPPSFVNFVVGDFAKLTGFTNVENNVNAIIVNKGVNYVDVANSIAINASSQAGTGLLSEKRIVAAYNQLTGQVTVGVAFTSTPGVGNSLMVIPSTTQNVVDYLNNTRITSISLKADIEGVSNDTLVQIASQSEGSDGYVQVTGGNANDVLEFDTSLFRGLAGYEYWTGLTKLVHSTVYGDDSDLTSFAGVGAAGIIFRILAPTTIDFPVSLQVALKEGFTISALENEIRSAVTGYVNSLGVGEEVVIEEIRASVIAIAGIVDVVILDPVANIPTADNELARVADSAILIG
jgi:uncharacterized phage protein gp47/JayE